MTTDDIPIYVYHITRQITRSIRQVQKSSSQTSFLSTMPIPANNCRLSSVDSTNTSTGKASRTTWFGMGLAERGDQMIVATNTLMGGILCRQWHHGGCLVLCDAAVWRELVDWNMFECTAEISTWQRLKEKYLLPCRFRIFVEPFVLKRFFRCQSAVWVICK